MNTVSLILFSWVFYFIPSTDAFVFTAHCCNSMTASTSTSTSTSTLSIRKISSSHIPFHFRHIKGFSLLHSSSSSLKCTYSSSSKSQPIDSPKLAFYNELIELFQGDFDNYNQILGNQKKNLSAGEGGGHEHIHATIVPLSHKTNLLIASFITANDKPPKTDSDDFIVQNVTLPPSPHFVMACYYLDGIPSKIFRLRLYSLEPTTQQNNNMVKLHSNSIYKNNWNVLLKIYTFDTGIMSEIKAKADEPTLWENIIYQSLLKQDQNIPSSLQSPQQQTQPPLFQILSGCNVLWTPSHDPKRHAYIFSDCADHDYSSLILDSNNISENKESSFHAIMLNETGAVLPSMMIPGKQIRVQDELSLWGTRALWINDRGFDLDTGEYIYGNRRGIPYKLDRVAWFEYKDQTVNSNGNSTDIHIDSVTRKLVNNDVGKALS